MLIRIAQHWLTFSILLTWKPILSSPGAARSSLKKMSNWSLIAYVTLGTSNMSDHPPQFPEPEPRRQFRPKFFLSIDAFEGGASVQEPAIDANGVSQQKEVPGAA